MVMGEDKCGETWVTSDGQGQPALNGEPYYIVQRLIASATPSPAADVAPAGLLSDLSSSAGRSGEPAYSRDSSPFPRRHTTRT